MAMDISNKVDSNNLSSSDSLGGGFGNITTSLLLESALSSSSQDTTDSSSSAMAVLFFSCRCCCLPSSELKMPLSSEATLVRSALSLNRGGFGLADDGVSKDTLSLLDPLSEVWHLRSCSGICCSTESRLLFRWCVCWWCMGFRRKSRLWLRWWCWCGFLLAEWVWTPTSKHMRRRLDRDSSSGMRGDGWDSMSEPLPPPQLRLARRRRKQHLQKNNRVIRTAIILVLNYAMLYNF